MRYKNTLFITKYIKIKYFLSPLPIGIAYYGIPGEDLFNIRSISFDSMINKLKADILLNCFAVTKSYLANWKQLTRWLKIGEGSITFESTIYSIFQLTSSFHYGQIFGLLGRQRVGLKTFLSFINKTVLYIINCRSDAPARERQFFLYTSQNDFGK